VLTWWDELIDLKEESESESDSIGDDEEGAIALNKDIPACPLGLPVSILRLPPPPPSDHFIPVLIG
jgi:hypothetical protein